MHQPRPRGNGTRERVRFPAILNIALPQRHADELERLASDGLLTTSDHARLAIDQYLAAAGVLAPPLSAPMNPHDHEAANG
jgi:hypothetical protein